MMGRELAIIQGIRAISQNGRVIGVHESGNRISSNKALPPSGKPCSLTLPEPHLFLTHVVSSSHALPRLPPSAFLSPAWPI